MICNTVFPFIPEAPQRSAAVFLVSETFVFPSSPFPRALLLVEGCPLVLHSSASHLKNCSVEWLVSCLLDSHCCSGMHTTCTRSYIRGGFGFHAEDLSQSLAFPMGPLSRHRNTEFQWMSWEINPYFYPISVFPRKKNYFIFF